MPSGPILIVAFCITFLSSILFHYHNPIALQPRPFWRHPSASRQLTCKSTSLAVQFGQCFAALGLWRTIGGAEIRQQSYLPQSTKTSGGYTAHRQVSDLAPPVSCLQ